MKISNIKQITRGTADHDIISVTYRLKGVARSKMETIGRDRRNFSENELKRLMALQDWSSVLAEQNVDIATFVFENKFLEILNSLVPLKRFQPRSRRTDWISCRTKILMKLRDDMRDKAVRSSQLEDWAEYRLLRNSCNKHVKDDRKENLKKHYVRLHENNDARGLYSLTKKKMGWKTGGAETFIINGETISNPRKMADVEIECFQNKIKNLIDKLPPPK